MNFLEPDPLKNSKSQITVLGFNFKLGRSLFNLIFIFILVTLQDLILNFNLVLKLILGNSIYKIVKKSITCLVLLFIKNFTLSVSLPRGAVLDPLTLLHR